MIGGGVRYVRPRLGVGWIALALSIAAFAGAALGLVVDFSDGDEVAETEQSEAEETAG